MGMRDILDEILSWKPPYTMFAMAIAATQGNQWAAPSGHVGNATRRTA